MDIDPVEQRSRDALLVPGDDGMCTGTGFLRITVPAAGAGLHTKTQDFVVQSKVIGFV